MLMKLTPGFRILFESNQIIILQPFNGKFLQRAPQLRCTEFQLKMRLVDLHLKLKRVAHEQNTRLNVGLIL